MSGRSHDVRGRDCQLTCSLFFLSDFISKGAGPGSEFKRQSVKYSAHKLHEKGVVLEIEGLPKHQLVHDPCTLIKFN